MVLGKEDGGSNIKSSQELWFQPKIDLSLNNHYKSEVFSPAGFSSHKWIENILQIFIKSNDQLYKYLFVKWFERYVRLFSEINIE